ncbi:hypothetical protein Pcinc_016377 [Petrolisthes cinctipes]|uniref:Peroxinectin n=1 Tax=Petrolisthes cinctipes TaxID=88211 RepID=A0AAE1FSG0_PETCI|nr:hypothetical protein Pcinc_016377 [Petrolisthes cinctipes]
MWGPSEVFVAVLAATTLTAGQVLFPDSQPHPFSATGGAGAGGGGGGGDAIFFPRATQEPEVPCTTYEGKGGSCRLLIKCATFYAEIAQLSRSPCSITDTQSGVCCPSTKEATADVGVLISKQPPGAPLQLGISPPQINTACEKGLQSLTEKEKFETQLLTNNIVAQKGTPVSLHAQLFQTTNEIVHKAKDAEKNLAASVNLVREFNLTKNQGGFGLPTFGVQNTIIANTCPPEPQCPVTKYRTVDGTCNNLGHKSWGSGGTAFQRILAPDYDEGVNTPRFRAQSGARLPSPRTVSSQVILDRDSIYDNFTLLIMQWGQFLDHDITHTPITKGMNMSDITCCSKGQQRDLRELHPDCMPILIPETDSFYAKFGQKCMEFVRSMPAVRPKCNFGPREQMNQITSYLDASNVYGSNLKEMRELRTNTGGLLKDSNTARHLLPPKPSECRDNTGQHFCFLAGDSRVNEQPQLAVMHTIWMRQHNKLARELAALNPGWNDEVLYQEARRIVAAQMQHITYHEYLPIILGRRFMETFGLVPRKSGYSPGYRKDIDSTITNAFATAAFRYGHTLISGSMKMFDKFGIVNSNLRLSEHQFSPFTLYEKDGIDSLLRGISFQRSQKFDRFFSEELTNHLFAGKSPFGMDLVALNIQRGRDHGLPGYNQWRKICQLPLAKDFADLTDVMDPTVVEQLRQIYEHVDDIDIFIGGIAETPSPGSLLGHTFLCIVGDQFARLRLGDRFFYENGELESSFSLAQLEQIRHTSMARVMCDNSDDLEMMQPLAFIRPHLANMRASCKVGPLIPHVSLDPWKNEPVWV